MADKKWSYLKDFSGGLNTKDAPNLIPANSLTDAENAVLGKGVISKRSGYERYIYAPVERIATWQDVGGKKWSEL